MGGVDPLPPPAPERLPRVVIVGAGFAGLWCARRLADRPVDVLLLDRQNYHTFLPLLYQVAAAELGPTEIAYPVRSIFRGAKNIRFRMAEVERVDLEEREVVTGAGRVPYDHLVLAMGSVAHYFGVEGAAEHAFGLRSMDDAIPLRHHILTRFERASFESSPEEVERALTFVVVGGGPTGVEFSGALAELIYGPLRKDYPTLDVGQARIVLVETLDQLLAGMPRRLADYAVRRLEGRNVEVRLGTAVSRVEPGAVDLADGSRVEADTVVWTGGVQGVPGPEEWGLPIAKGGRIQTRPTLEVPGRPGVWVAGDLAWFEEDGQPLPGVAPVAMQQGHHVAESIIARIHDREPRPFEYKDRGMLAVIGRNAAVAQIGDRSFTGRPAWLLWLAIHVGKLIGFRNRALVLVNWAWNYIFFTRAVRLILPYPRPGSRERTDAPAPRSD